MPKFKYKAVSPEGDILEDQIAAADKIAVVQHLKNLNLAAIEISRDEVKHSKNLSRKKLKVKHVLLFTMQLHTLLKAGISIVHSLNVIKEQNADPLFNYVLEDISHKVQQGNSLSEALGYYPKIFPSIFVNSIKVGELSGTLEEALVNLYQYIEEDDRMRKEVKKALRYPLIVLLAMIGAFLVFTLLVIPNFMPLFEMHSAELPLPTKILLGIHDVMANYGITVAVSLMLLIVIFIFIKRSAWGQHRLDLFLLSAPIFGTIIRMVNLARFAKIFYTLNRSGIPVVQAFEMMKDNIENSVYRQELSMALENIKLGRGIAESLGRSPYFNKFVVEMISIGEQSGALDDMLHTVTQYYDQDVRETLNNLTSLIEPVTTAVMGGMILFLALSLFLPLWDTMSMVQQ